MPSRACTDSGLVYSAKGRIFSNMLQVRYVHLTKGQEYSFIWDKPIFSSERMLRKDYYCKGSIEKNLWSWVSRGLTPRRTDWWQTASRKVTFTLTMTLTFVRHWVIQSEENSEGSSVVELSWVFSYGVLTSGQRKLKKWPICKLEPCQSQ
jgi:hypothetical protein